MILTDLTDHLKLVIYQQHVAAPVAATACIGEGGEWSNRPGTWRHLADERGTTRANGMLAQAGYDPKMTTQSVLCASKLDLYLFIIYEAS